MPIPTSTPTKIHVIYNGIDLCQYQYTAHTDALIEYGVDPMRPYVLFVGRITRQKGVTHLVDAIQYLPPGTQVVLCAGAPDTPEIAAEMRAKVDAARLSTPGSLPALVERQSDGESHPEGHAQATGDYTGQGHNIVWIEKMVTKAEAIQLYSHCAVFCCPSVYEPFGIINLEAMACRAPVVASATGGILEVVVDPTHPSSSRDVISTEAERSGETCISTTASDATGYLVPFAADETTGFPKDEAQFSRDLAEKINALLADPAKARAMGNAGRKRVEDTFSWTAIADQTIALYESLVKEISG